MIHPFQSTHLLGLGCSGFRDTAGGCSTPQTPPPEQIGLNKREAKDFIDAFFDLIGSQLVDGQDAKISGFGNFEVRTKSARPGRNPRTGEPVTIPPRRVITFKTSGQLKEKIN